MHFALIKTRIPTDQNILKQWKEALGYAENYVLRGMICSSHFNQDNLVPATQKSQMRLKKNAIPIAIEKINDSPSEWSESLASPEAPEVHDVQVLGATTTATTKPGPELPAESNSDCSNCSNCSVLEAELKHLREDFTKMELKNKTEMSVLEVKIDALQSKLSAQKNDAYLLRKRLAYARSSKEKLQTTLKDLQQQNQLCKEVVDFIQVSFVSLRHLSFVSILNHFKRLSSYI